MPGLALTINGIGVVPTDAGAERINMKTLEAVLAALTWIVLAIVLYALSPLLIKLIQMADHLNHVFGH